MRNKIRRTLEGEDNWEGYEWEKSCISNELSFEKGRKQLKNIKEEQRGHSLWFHAFLTLLNCFAIFAYWGRGRGGEKPLLEKGKKKHVFQNS